eukprot:GEMP01037131.1.p1 GENE.GEMP01037131.1~~GEMP01037131.1.p1  ORF type:complete len:424 (+),score=84.84 GEMP01037131.1:194-1465(+)
MKYGEALKLLGLEYYDTLPTEKKLQHAFRRKAMKCHPDKVETDDTSDFIALTEAFEIVQGHVRSTVVLPQNPKIKESERLDKHYFGTAFGSDAFDPRKWEGSVAAKDPTAVQCVWRCTQCPEGSSICCRLKPAKHSCICAHKLSDHKDGRCTANCKCNDFTFHVQQGAWQVKCSCKHAHRDHAVNVDKDGKSRFQCTKHIPGHRENPCPCVDFSANWVCTCGHGWTEHETVWCTNVSKALFAREWVACGIRPECVKEAEEKRQKWADRCADHAAITKDPVEAKRKAALLARKRGLSVVAEAKMREAVDDLSKCFLCGTRSFRCVVKQGVAFRSKPKMNAKTDRVLQYDELVTGVMFINWVKIDAHTWLPLKSGKGLDILAATDHVDANSRSESDLRNDNCIDMDANGTVNDASDCGDMWPMPS